MPICAQVMSSTKRVSGELAFIILAYSGNSLFETDSRFPAKNFFCARDIWLAYFRIILGQGLKFNSRFCSGNANDLVGKLLDCHLARIAKVDRLVEIAHC